MESIWFIVLITVSICLTLKSLFNLLKHNPKLPPGPLSIPILSNLQWLRKSFADLEPILRNLRSKYGPIITLQVGHRKAIFITTPDLAHQALIQNGAAFADRPPAPETAKLVNSNQHNISSASYGSLWRLLRRNLTYQILHPSKIKSFTPARKWVMEILKSNLKSESQSGKLPVRVVDQFQYAMFCLLVLMCFGEKLDEKKIREIESVQRALLLSFGRFNILNFFPKFSKILFRNRWQELYQLRRNQEEVLVPLIRSRQENQKKIQQEEKFLVVAYVDSLLDLNLPDEGGRKLEEHEIVSLCSEFLNAGTDTTSTALQWIMANLVKHQEIQSKLVDEIKNVVKSEEDEIKEEDLQKMPYLKAVVLEGLRRHPPGHFVLPHAVTEDIQLDGYLIPKDASVNFMVAEIGCDPKLWKDPMEFRPERFLSGEGIGEGFDITGSREIKMMPFGAGRRICPGLGLAMLHLEYFVANLVREFEWTARIGDDVDLSDKQEFTMVMKNPLWAHISPRMK
ncbi:Cytochrome P450 [Macleaya cordata]|uniref:Cytochrome P450 n=1 Tax=Macleaya cordata TaxID=56857 RepID=A0A200R6R8_MACCD|nr:Cytochrome P450 [Macleaya cordata]